jgi:hypothetical protein
MSILSEIYEGWKNYTFPNPKIEEIAKKRIEICVKNECKRFRSNKSCALCGCYMPAKVRSPKSRCKIGKW